VRACLPAILPTRQDKVTQFSNLNALIMEGGNLNAAGEAGGDSQGGGDGGGIGGSTGSGSGSSGGGGGGGGDGNAGDDGGGGGSSGRKSSSVGGGAAAAAAEGGMTGEEHIKRMSVVMDSLVRDRPSVQVQLYRTVLVNQRVSFRAQYAEGKLGRRGLTSLLAEWECARDELDVLEERIAALLSLDGEPVHVDDMSEVSLRPALHWDDLSHVLQVPEFLERVQNWRWVGRFAEQAIYNQLTLGIDVAKGFSEATAFAMSQLDATGDLVAIGESKGVLTGVREQLKEQRVLADSVLNDMSNIFPEVGTLPMGLGGWLVGMMAVGSSDGPFQYR
jgi:hypothetical protein